MVYMVEQNWQADLAGDLVVRHSGADFGVQAEQVVSKP